MNVLIVIISLTNLIRTSCKENNFKEQLFIIDSTYSDILENECRVCDVIDPQLFNTDEKNPTIYEYTDQENICLHKLQSSFDINDVMHQSEQYTSSIAFDNSYNINYIYTHNEESRTYHDLTNLDASIYTCPTEIDQTYNENMHILRDNIALPSFNEFFVTKSHQEKTKETSYDSIQESLPTCYISNKDKDIESNITGWDIPINLLPNIEKQNNVSIVDIVNNSYQKTYQNYYVDNYLLNQQNDLYFTPSRNKRKLSEINCFREPDDMSHPKKSREINEEQLISSQNMSENAKYDNQLSFKANSTCAPLIIDGLSTSSSIINIAKSAEILETKDLKFEIDFNEKECEGRSRRNLNKYTFRLMYDYNLRNLQEENKKMNECIFDYIDRTTLTKYGMHKILQYLKNFGENPELSFNINIIKPTTLYLIQILGENPPGRKNNMGENINDVLKFLFYLIYPFLKIIDLPQSSGDVQGFYSDFIQVFEILTLLRKSLVAFEGNKYNSLETTFIKEYEFKKTYFNDSNVFKLEIQKLELALQSTDPELKNMKTTLEIFKEHLQILKSYIPDFYATRKASRKLYFCKKTLLYVFYIISHDYYNIAKNKKSFIHTETIAEEIPLSNSGIITLLRICAKLVQIYTILQIRHSIIYIVKPIESKISKFQKNMERELRAYSQNKTDSPHRKKIILECKQNRKRQIIKLKIYNLSMLVMIKFTKDYNEFYIKHSKNGYI